MPRGRWRRQGPPSPQLESESKSHIPTKLGSFHAHNNLQPASVRTAHLTKLKLKLESMGGKYTIGNKGEFVGTLQVTQSCIRAKGSELAFTENFLSLAVCWGH